MAVIKRVSVVEDVKKLKPSHTVGNTQQYTHFGKQTGPQNVNQSYHMT